MNKRLMLRDIAVLALALCGGHAPAQGLPPGFKSVIDLTHAYDESTVYWPTASGFELRRDFRGYTDKGFYYEANSFSTAEHGGTHLDSPVHFAEGKWTVEQIPVRNLMGPAAVIDVIAQCAEDRDYQVTVADVTDWEAVHGPLPEGAIVLLNTGFAQYWPDRERYMGTDERGEAAVPKLHFPGLHPDTATWLVKNRDINAIGLDTPSIDYGQSTVFESHQNLFEANIAALENVANLDALPPAGAWVIALPMKIRGGSGAPLRIVALVP